MERSKQFVVNGSRLTASASFREDEELQIEHKGSCIEITGEGSGVTLQLGYGIVEALQE